MQILKLEKLTDQKWLNLFSVSYENKGHTGQWIFASRKKTPYKDPGADAVVIVAVLREEGVAPRLVLVREMRVPVGGYNYGLPAGLIEAGEKVETAVRRELLEETGLEVTAFHCITPPVYASSGMSDESAVLAFVDVRATKEGHQALEATEDIEVHLVSQEEAGKLCRDQTQVFDVRAWMACSMFSSTGRVI